MPFLELTSQLPVEVCAARLGAAIDRDGLLSVTGSKPVVGRVSGGSVRLRKRIDYRNGFQALFTGTLRPQGAGTVIRGRFGMRRWLRWFIAFWFGWVLLIGGIIFVDTLQALLGGPAQVKGNLWVGVVVPPAMLVFSVALVWTGRYVARGEAEFLTAFLMEVLHAARPASPARPGGCP